MRARVTKSKGIRRLEKWRLNKAAKIEHYYYSGLLLKAVKVAEVEVVPFSGVWPLE